MITIQKNVRDLPDADLKALDPYLPSDKAASSSVRLFFDIETTGLSRQRHQIYLIGTLLWYGDSGVFYQWLAQTPAEECQVLTAFLTLLKRQTVPVVPVHFNGARFDLPFFETRCNICGLDGAAFCALPGIDLYLLIKPFRTLLGLASCRQKSIEDFLGIRREDTYDGGGLIPVFHRYCQSRRAEDERLLLLHNQEDVENMPRLTAIFSYITFFRQPFTWYACKEATYQDLAGRKQQELFVRYRARQQTIPAPLTIQQDFPGRQKKAPEHPQADRFWISCKERELTLRVPLFARELKYFFADYKNYFYLPAEDRAIHKSVGIYVDPQFRQKATAKTCYTRTDGLFFPALQPDQQPCFYEAYKDRQGFLCWEDGNEICGQSLNRFWEQYLSLLLKPSS